ncbi:hypothetical protein R3P38DRAFT_2852165 [Favolaschia claudopus]|uniref:Uncharacterized protein n=1 Tax=Favolaschia claudopus TaxID=2862362 RepID=A0AAW0DRC5_9AGAR
MPILTPSQSAPEGSDASETSSFPTDSKGAAKPTNHQDIDVSTSIDTSRSNTVAKITLDVENLNSEIASELSSALVGHVLFLKNQVPFPVMQLSRMPGAKSTPKALKLRTDLMSSFDTLSSHLHTTFNALSTAFALATESSSRPTRLAYLAILVGPSIGSAKTKIMLGLDGLVTKVWGERDDLNEEPEDSDSEDESDDDDSEEDKDDDEEGPELSDTDSDESEASSPLPSRSPSPSPEISPLPAPPSAPKAVRPPNRILAQTLATADHSMSAELGMFDCLFAFGHCSFSNTCLAPTQTHILIRAPRRFTHPSWIPRQNFSSTLDSALREFREEAGDLAAERPPSKSRSKAPKVEGVWVTCRNPGVEFSGEDAVEDEEHEMIWWSWDGKLVGFNDW